MTRDEILDLYPEDTMMFADGLDDTIIGVEEGTARVVYACIDCFISQGMTYEEAVEWFNYNTIRGAQYMGEKSPIFIHT